MKENRKPSIQVTSSHLDLSALLASFASEPNFKQQLESTDVLIIPTDLGKEHGGSAFPQITRDVFQCLREKLSGRATVDAAVRDADYVEFGYHSETIILPIIYIAEHVLLPLVIGILAAMIRDRLRNRSKSTRVTSELHFKGQGGNLLFFKYDGPAKEFEKLILDSLQKLDTPPNGKSTPSKGQSDNCK